MQVQILASGSSGNAVVIDKHILVDAGVPRKEIVQRDLEIQTLIITHPHGDHMKFPLVRHLLSEGVKAYLPVGAIGALAEEGRLDPTPLVEAGQIVVLNDSIKERLLPGRLRLTALSQSHHDMTNYALVFENKRTEKRLLYATDLDTLSATPLTKGLYDQGTFDTILLEGNYDEDYLREYIRYMIRLLPEETDPDNMTDQELEKWVRLNYQRLPDVVARNAFRAIQNRRHLSKQQARAYVRKHLRPGGTYYEIHRSRTFYEEAEDWRSTFEGL